MSIQTVSLGPVFGDVAFSENLKGAKLWEFEYRKNQTIPQHEHRHPYICFLIEGDALEQDSVNEISYSANRLMYIPRGHRHKARIGPEGARFLGFEITSDFFQFEVKADDLPVKPICLDTPALRTIMHKVTMEARNSLMLLTHADWPHEILQHLLPHTAKESPLWLNGVLDYLRANVSSSYDLEFLAKIAGRHPTHLLRTFKYYTGVSIGEYHRKLKVDLACRLIRKNRLKLTEIAQVCGFADQSHFIRVFREYMKMAPSQFRKAFRR